MFGQYKRLRNEVDGRADRQGPVLRRQPGPYRRPPATACATLPRNALNCMKNDSFKGKTVVISGSGNVAIYATEKATAAGRQGRGSVRFHGLCLRQKRHRPGCGQGDQAGSRVPASPSMLSAVPAAELSPKAAAASGASPAISRCPAPRRMRSTRPAPSCLPQTAVKVVCEGANMPSTPEAIERVSRKTACSTARPRPPTPAAWPPAAWR